MLLIDIIFTMNLNYAHFFVVLFFCLRYVTNMYSQLGNVGRKPVGLTPLNKTGAEQRGPNAPSSVRKGTPGHGTTVRR